MRSFNPRTGGPFSPRMEAGQYLLPWSDDPVGQPTSEELNDRKTEEERRQRRQPMRLLGASKSAGKPRLKDRVAMLLTDRNIPFVDVDQAKRALFQSAQLRAFHFVAYSLEGLNWLIFAATVTAESMRDMAEWERVFGEGFMPVLASTSRRETVGIQFRTLAGVAVHLPGTSSAHPVRLKRTRAAGGSAGTVHQTIGRRVPGNQFHSRAGW